jgi:hypothetical protein
VSALRLGVESGRLPSDLDLDLAVASLIGPCIYDLLLKGEELTAAFVDEVVDSFLLPYDRST